MSTDLAVTERPCTVTGYESAWVRFKTRGYPRKLRREWDAAKPDAALEIVLRYVDEWNLTDVDGRAVTLPDGERPAATLDNCEDALVIWLIREFQQFWLYELPFPKKNS